jgi:hypothetical protein
VDKLDDSAPSQVDTEGTGDRTSRRRLFQMGAVGVSALAGAAVSDALSAEPADAATGGSMLIGSANTTSSNHVATTLSGGAFKVLGGTGAVAALQGSGGPGVAGSGASATFNGVQGSGAIGVLGSGVASSTPSVAGVGVLGQGANGAGLQGASTNGPALLLQETGNAVPPTTGSWSTGSFLVRSADGALFFCHAGGTPGSWVQLSNTLITLVPSVRAYDSRSSGGPLGSGERAVSLASAIPAGAATALINLTIADTVGAGFLGVFKNGTSWPGTSNINWYSSNQIVANNATVAVDSSRNMKVHAGGPGSTDFIVDVMGYYL